MSVTLLIKHHLEFVNLKEGCTGSSESIHVKMPHRWKSHVAAYITKPGPNNRHKPSNEPAAATWTAGLR